MPSPTRSCSRHCRSDASRDGVMRAPQRNPVTALPASFARGDALRWFGRPAATGAAQAAAVDLKDCGEMRSQPSRGRIASGEIVRADAANPPHRDSRMALSPDAWIQLRVPQPKPHVLQRTEARPRRVAPSSARRRQAASDYTLHALARTATRSLPVRYGRRGSTQPRHPMLRSGAAARCFAVWLALGSVLAVSCPPLAAAHGPMGSLLLWLVGIPAIGLAVIACAARPFAEILRARR